MPSIPLEAQTTADAAGNATLAWPAMPTGAAMNVTLTVDGPATDPAPITLGGQLIGFLVAGRMSFGPFVIGPGERLAVAFSGAQPGAAFMGSIRGADVHPNTAAVVNPTAIPYPTGGVPASTFGGGTDGDVTIAGTVTLTRDMQYGNLTISPGARLLTAGYVVYVAGSLTFADGTGHISADGGAGQPGVAGIHPNVGGAGGAGAASVYNTAGSAGGAGGNDQFAGNAGANVTAMGLDVIGGSGAPGGGGGHVYGGPAAGGAGGTLTQTQNGAVLTFGPSLASAKLGAGSGGGGGGGGFYNTGGGGSGGGGGGGGAQAIVFARNITGAGIITASGGGGGDGGNGSIQADGGGGGGGGGGGVAVAIYATSTAGWAPTNVKANGGNGGNGGNGVGGGGPGVAGLTGNSGQAFAIQVTVA